jgi:hypothetical protein
LISRIGRLLSFSNVIACLALFIALGGSVYAAATINGKQIKRSSLPGNRIKPKTIPSNRIKPKSLTGRQIKPNSLTGAQINQKTLTGVSAAALASIQYETTTTTLSGGFRATPAAANCPSGMYVIGGGATVSNEEETRVNDSGPTPLRTGWTATAFSWSGNGTMTVTAICVVIEKPGSRVTTVQYHPGG